MKIIPAFAPALALGLTISSTSGVSFSLLFSLSTWPTLPLYLMRSGEYFEVFNDGATSIPLAGLTISDDGTNSFTIDAAETGSIAPGQFFVFGASGLSYVDFVWSNYALANGADEIIVNDGTSET